MCQLQLWKPAPSLLRRWNAPLHRLIQIFGHGVRQADQFEYRGWRNTSPIHGRFRVKKSLFRNITLLTGYTRTYGFSRHTLFRLVCMQVRFEPLLTYNKAKRWTVPFRNDCWQCWKGCWKSKTPRLHGVSCESSVDWNPYSSIGFARQCGCTNLWLNPTATQWKRSRMLTCSLAHGPMIAGQPILILPWMVWHNRIPSNKAAKLWTHWSQPFCRRPERETHGVLDTSFWDSSERTQHSKRSTTYHQWCALPTKRALVTHLPSYILPKYMFLNLPRNVIRSAARFRLRVHTLRFETATWNESSNSPTCDLCDV
jgi:hypothetical protein